MWEEVSIVENLKAWLGVLVVIIRLVLRYRTSVFYLQR